MKKKKAEQTELPAPGFKRKVAPEINRATEVLNEARTEKKNAKEAEDAAVEKLIVAMRKHEVDVYKFTDDEGVEVTVRIKEGKTKVTVSKKKPAQADEAN